MSKRVYTVSFFPSSQPVAGVATNVKAAYEAMTAGGSKKANMNYNQLREKLKRENTIRVALEDNTVATIQAMDEMSKYSRVS